LSAPYIPHLKSIINQIDSGAAETITRQALELGDSTQIRQLLESLLED
jgi:phosphoenolpyruvate-protein kinase (PTS system EI component)